jgi:hypothetical protein
MTFECFQYKRRIFTHFESFHRIYSNVYILLATILHLRPDKCIRFVRKLTLWAVHVDQIHDVLSDQLLCRCKSNSRVSIHNRWFMNALIFLRVIYVRKYYDMFEIVTSFNL